MEQHIDLRKQTFSFMGAGSSFKGTFHFSGATNIASQLEGEISMQDDAELSINYTGKVMGQINCNNIDIYGEFEGKITSTGVVTLHPTSTVKGQIEAKNLVVYPGANLNIEGETTEEN